MKFSRRSFNTALSTSLASLLAYSVLPGTAFARPIKKQNIVIVGGGSSGIYCAWLLSQIHNVTLVEEAEVLGGHAITRPATVFDHPLSIDIGAQYYSDDAYPLFAKLLNLTGQSHLAHAFQSDFVMEDEAGKITLLSPNIARLLNPEYDFNNARALLAFARFHNKAQKTPPDTMPLGEWFAKTGISHTELDKVVRPMTAVVGSGHLDHLDEESAGVILGYIKKMFPHGLSIVPQLKLFRQGLAPVLQEVARQSSARTVLGQSVVSVQRRGKSWQVVSNHGQTLNCDQVILCSPPWKSASIEGLPSPTAQALQTFDTLQRHVVIHKDTTVMPEKRDHWAFNAIRTQTADEVASTQWIGRELLPSQELPLFKTILTPASSAPIQPAHIIFEHTFTHPMYSQRTVKATRDMNQWQGKSGLWFCNASLFDYDCQESALSMAVSIAKSLAPSSPTLQALTG